MQKTPELIKKQWELKFRQLKARTEISHRQKIEDLHKRLEQHRETEAEKRIRQYERKKESYLKKKEIEYKRKCENQIRKLQDKPEKVYKPKRLSKNQKLNIALQVQQENSKLRDTDERGNGRCISCGDYHTRSELAGGHYFSRQIQSICLRPENINAQCHKCNLITGPLGNVQLREKTQRYYQVAIIEKFGKEKIQEMEQQRDKRVMDPKKYTPTEIFLDEYIPDLIKENDRLRKTKKFSPPQRKNRRKLYKKYFNLTIS